MCFVGNRALYCFLFKTINNYAIMIDAKQLVCHQVDTIMVGSFMMVVFFYIMMGYAGEADLPAHASIAKQMLEENRLFENNFLLYFVANLLTLFSGNVLLIKYVLVILIGVSNTTKYIIVRDEFARRCSIMQARLASAALLFVFIIPVLYFLRYFNLFKSANTMYLGYYVPNVWHNSTILCMMPFAILTFFLSIRQLKEYEKKRNGLITLFVALGVLVKPSFFFIWGVAYPICMFVRYRFSKEFFYSLIPVVIGLLFVLYEYLTIFNSGDAEVVINVLPLFTTVFWSSHWLCLAISLALPMTFVLLYWEEVYKDLEFWFILVMLVVALGISWCCHETGDRIMHGNFGWQVVPAMWFVYYYVLKTALNSEREKRLIEQKPTSSVKVAFVTKGKVFLCIYLLHVAVGIFYLGRFLVAKIYY